MECLITRLKASVTDENLKKLGELRIKKARVSSPNTDTAYILLVSGSDIQVSALGSASFVDATLSTSIGNKITIEKNTNGNIWITNGGEISIVRKYDLKTIQCLEAEKFHLEDLQYCIKLNSLQIKPNSTKNEIVGDLSAFAATLPSEMELFSITFAPLITGDIASLSNVAFKNFECFGDYGLTGVIESLNVSKLETLGVGESNIGGSIEQLVAKLIASGRTSGTISVPYINYKNNITYKGIALDGHPNVPAPSGSNKLTWDASGNITWS